MVLKKKIIILNYGYSGYESISNAENRESINIMKDIIKDLGLKVINKPSKTFGDGKLKVIVPKNKNITKEDIIKKLSEVPANLADEPVTNWYAIE